MEVVQHHDASAHWPQSVSGRIPLAILAAMSARGVCTEDIVRELSIDREAIFREDARYTVHGEQELWRACEARRGAAAAAASRRSRGFESARVLSWSTSNSPS